VQSLGNRPGDGALVRDPEDNGVAALKVREHGFSLEWERITVDGVDLLQEPGEMQNLQFSIANFRWKIDDGESVLEIGALGMSIVTP
jgi:hypothetical protein